MRNIVELTKRDAKRYFSNPTAYVFITIFVFLSAVVAFWREVFFQNNLANLNTLNEYFPFLLLFFIPAIAMNSWSDEKKMKTDELILTLPITELQIILGKYFSVLIVYALALIFSLCHIIVLLYLGEPDIGLMFGTYLGYFLIGAMLIGFAMIGSLISESPTIAFIIGALLCAIIVFVEKASLIFGEKITSIGVSMYFEELTRGIISLSTVSYFLSGTILGLACNFFILKVRRMRLEKLHLIFRLAFLFIGFIFLNVFLSRFYLRADLTEENLHSLSDATKRIITNIEEDRLIFLNAYISEEVPQEYAQVKEDLLNTIKEIEALSKGKILSKIIITDIYSREAEEADEKFGIKPQKIFTRTADKIEQVDVILGVACVSGGKEAVVPFFYNGMAVEYELVRSIKTVLEQKSIKVGVVSDDCNMFARFDAQVRRFVPEWTIIEEMKRQYIVEQVNIDDKIDGEFDVLVVPMPSTLTQKQIDALYNYVKEGKPVLILDDPLPFFDFALAPYNPRKKAPQNPYSTYQQGEQKGDIEKFLQSFGINWQKEYAVWNSFNPHPQISEIDPENIFISSQDPTTQAFNSESVITSGLQEIFVRGAGAIESANKSGITFTPLIKIGKNSGILKASELFINWGFGYMSNPMREYLQTKKEYTIAAYLNGHHTNEKNESISVNIIYIADVDFLIYIIREKIEEIEDLILDNATFFLNCVEFLARDISLVDLRKRRKKHRILKKLEEKTQIFKEEQAKEMNQAKILADNKLEEAQDRMNEKIKALESEETEDARAKEKRLEALIKTEEKRLEEEKKNIEREKEKAIQQSKIEMERDIKRVRNTLRWLVILLPPIPGCVVALSLFVFRLFQRKGRVV